MGQVVKLQLPCYLVLIYTDGRNQVTRQPQFRHLTLSQSIGLFVLDDHYSGVDCHYLLISFLVSYFITIITTSTGMFMFMAIPLNHKFLKLGISGAAVAHLTGYFCPWTFF